MSNIDALSDKDGGWVADDCLFVWNNGASTAKFVWPVTEGKLRVVGLKEDSATTGKIFTIDKEIFDSFVFDDVTKEEGGLTYRRIAPDKIGFNTRNKGFSELKGYDDGAMNWDSQWVEEPGILLYAVQDGENYYLWIENYTKLVGAPNGNANQDNARMTLVWKNAAGEICCQTMRYFQ